MTTSRDRVSFFGLEVQNVTLLEIEEELKEALTGDRLVTISTPNTEIAMNVRKDKDFRDLLNSFDIVIPDGIGLVIGSKIRGCPLKERVTGFDTSMKLLKLAKELDKKVYLLGGGEGVAERAGVEVEKDFGVQVVGTHSGYFQGAHIGAANSEEDLKILKEIEDSGADILFVGMGSPKQESWINWYKDRLTAKVAIGNGGVIDILAKDLKRAPEIFQKLGLEWFYRLVKEPSRIKRQIVLPLFLLEAIFNKNSIKAVKKNE
ncbi:MAG: WecB/TagA/CpsF family glycosyltransferase [Tissierellia bacterium]|nr:WecB/TagA/CpsF family glycosyltransferase [Tissierellia bacterium]